MPVKNSSINLDSSASAYAYAYETGQVSTSSSGYVDLGSGTPTCSIVVPPSGAVLIEACARVGVTNVSQYARAAIQYSGAYSATETDWELNWNSSGSSPGTAHASPAIFRVLTGLTPGATLTAKMVYQTDGSGNAYFQQRGIYMSALPAGTVAAKASSANFPATGATFAYVNDPSYESTTSSSYSNTTLGTASIVVPPSGKVLVKYAARLGETTQGGAANATINYSGAFTETDDSTWSINWRASGTSGGNGNTSATSMRLLTGLTPGATLNASMRKSVGGTGVGTAYFSQKTILLLGMPG